MIAWLRKAATSLVAKALIALLVLSFAAWGIGDSLGGGAGSVVAEVEGEEVTVAEFRREFDLAMRQFQFPVTPEQARSFGLDQQVIARLAAGKVLDQETAALGVDAPDEQVTAFIHGSGAFQNALGEFDENAFQFAMRNSGLRADDYYETVRQEAARSFLIDTVQAGGLYPERAVSRIWERLNETRAIESITLTAGGLDAPAAPTDAELRAHYEENDASFTAPEYRTITFLWLKAEDRADPASISDAAIEEAYEARFDAFNSEEQRNIEQLVFDGAAEADAAAARIADGEGFAKVAADNGFEAGDIALGYVRRSDLFDPAIADAAFGETTEGLIGPVKTDFGWALLNINGVIAAESTSLTQAREGLAAELALEAARAALPELANAVEDARAEGAGLLEIGRTEALAAGKVVVDASGLSPEGVAAPDLPQDAAFLRTAFEMEPGEEMDLAELSNRDFYAVEVEAVQPPALRPFEDVRGDVLASWEVEARRAALEAAASAALSRLEAGETLADLAAELGQEIAAIDGVSRAGGGGGGLPDGALAAAFETDERGFFQAASNDGAERVIGQVVATAAPDMAAGAAEIAMIRDNFSQSLELDLIQMFQAAAMAERRVVTNPAAIDYALSPL